MSLDAGADVGALGLDDSPLSLALIAAGWGDRPEAVAYVSQRVSGQGADFQREFRESFRVLTNPGTPATGRGIELADL